MTLALLLSIYLTDNRKEHQVPPVFTFQYPSSSTGTRVDCIDPCSYLSD